MYENIVSDCMKGDRNAQKKLYDSFSNSMFVLCQRYFNCREEALDAVQEGFIKVFRDLKQFDSSKGNLSQWIRKIFVNTCLEMLRKKKVFFQDIETIPDVMDLGGNIMDDLNMHDLVRTIQKLPVGYRTVFNLYVIEGYTHAEIAQKLNISENTSKTQLLKAKASLKRVLEMAFNYYEYETQG